MAFDYIANDDFERATVKAFWRRITAWLTGTKNQLLPFDEVRRSLPLRGQRYIGMQQVPIDKILGSEGRYLDFDRTFLPTQTRTKNRWVSIDKAHLQQIDLPPVELYKIGEIYFVKDGNHRVSVARERGQDEIDAFVIELEVPVPISSDLTMDKLELTKAYAEFMEDTGLFRQSPKIEIDAGSPDVFPVLMEHIKAHRWFMGKQQAREIDWYEAAISWYSNVYQPLIDAMRGQDVKKRFPQAHEADLYIWIIQYQWFLRQSFEEMSEFQDADQVREAAAHKLTLHQNQKLVGRLAQVLRKANWVADMVLQQEQAIFLEETGLVDSPLADKIVCRQPWNYRRILEHISDHRWYLGEEQKHDVSMRQAAESWYERVYLPLVQIIREADLLNDHPGVGEGDLYLWVMARKEYAGEYDRDED